MARSDHPFDALAERFAEIVADRLSSVMPAGRSSSSSSPAGGKATKGRRGARPGRKLDMACRFPGCQNQSKGPRFRFFCDEHRKLPRKAQDAALEKYAAK